MANDSKDKARARTRRGGAEKRWQGQGGGVGAGVSDSYSIAPRLTWYGHPFPFSLPLDVVPFVPWMWSMAGADRALLVRAPYDAVNVVLTATERHSYSLSLVTAACAALANLVIDGSIACAQCVQCTYIVLMRSLRQPVAHPLDLPGPAGDLQVRVQDRMIAAITAFGDSPVLVATALATLANLVASGGGSLICPHRISLA